MKKLVILLGLLVCLSTFTFAQLNSTTASASMSGNIAEVVTISMTPSTLAFVPVTSGTGTTSNALSLTITTLGNLQPNRTGVTAFAYFTTATNVFTTPASGCTPTGNYVCGLDAADFQGKGIADAAFRAFGADTLPTGWTGAGLMVATHTGTGNFNYADSYQVKINSTKILSVGTYSGTLVVRAQAL